MSNVEHRTDRTQKALQQKPHPAVATTHPAVATTHLAVGVTHPAAATTHPAVAPTHLAVGVARLAATTTPLAIKWQQAQPASRLSCLPTMLLP